MRKKYVVQMEEIRVEDESLETLELWEGFYEPTGSYEQAKAQAEELLQNIRNSDLPELKEVLVPENHVGVCISSYSEDGSILDVIEIGIVPPEQWGKNVSKEEQWMEDWR